MPSERDKESLFTKLKTHWVFTCLVILGIVPSLLFVGFVLIPKQPGPLVLTVILAITIIPTYVMIRRFLAMEDPGRLDGKFKPNNGPKPKPKSPRGPRYRGPRKPGR